MDEENKESNLSGKDVEYYSFELEDHKYFKVDSRIKFFSKLFNNIIQDYGIDSNKSKLKGVYSEDINSITNFCEAINYNHEIKILPRSLALEYPNEIKNVFQAYPKLNSFFLNLNSKTISKLAKIADFYDVHLLEDTLYLKLYEVFSSKQNIELFFKEECEENATDIHKHTEIMKEREKYLRDKYMIYIDKYISQLTDEEVEKFLHKELENKIIND